MLPLAMHRSVLPAPLQLSSRNFGAALRVGSDQAIMQCSYTSRLITVLNQQIFLV